MFVQGAHDRQDHNQHLTKRQATKQLVLESHQRESTEHGVAGRPRRCYVHLELGFKKHGNGIHPPMCFLFKCVS
jgi:hypothetical protein